MIVLVDQIDNSDDDILRLGCVQQLALMGGVDWIWRARQEKGESEHMSFHENMITTEQTIMCGKRKEGVITQ